MNLYNSLNNLSMYRVASFDRDSYIRVRDLLSSKKINTVCIEANCPNRYECFSKKTATIMILGNVCTRNCNYCNVKKSKSGISLDQLDDKRKVVELIKSLSLKHVVITSVTRDDISDFGAKVFCECVEEIKKLCSDVRIELLIPDFGGNFDLIKMICSLDIDVLNHNIEVVDSLYQNLRPMGNYKMSLDILSFAKRHNSSLKIKSGLMVGFGESFENIYSTLYDLRCAGVDYISIGQYLAPSECHYAVRKYYSESEFNRIKTVCDSLGFLHAECGPLVRSSYNSSEYFDIEDKGDISESS